ncbi:type I secretion C-terminal target domain-containing protein [Rhizobium leguminosarum]|uniref:beta strand repeat-containing protein n=1 Tax=Rhizobium ruizarguesonis TaxID=2081791 RepID=UPI0013C58925|nr:type I secretion C-terminal target domain-containing protein [Rhizobium ruizarguesonis]NEJ60775.1 type I secretion C-terminal target domain-containing protein [Rhizobium ruizarguesonis]
MTLIFDPNNDPNANHIIGLLGAYGVASAAASALTDPPIVQAIKGIQTLREVNEVESKMIKVQQSDIPQELHFAVELMFIMNLYRGNPFPPDADTVMQAAWDTVNTGATSHGYSSNAAFWAAMNAQFPDDFLLDGSGGLIPPPSIASPLTTPDYSRPVVPLVPGALAPTVHDHTQPAISTAIATGSPLVIDLSVGHTGVTLTAWNASTTQTYFDLNNNGFAVQTAWVTGNTGLLARDLNSDGAIDSSSELFGSPTVDGFAKLAVLDSNHDLRIDNNDDAWSSLVVWTDTNGDALTESGELHSLSSLGILNIDLAGVTPSGSSISGNPISHTSTVMFTGGATATIADAWLVHDNTNSYYTGAVTLDPDVFYLPTLRGYGTLPDLESAMSLNSDLKDLVEDFAANFTMASFADPTDLNSAVLEILYSWAGISGVSAGSRGPYVDAQHLEFLEHFTGADFYQQGTFPNPWGDAGRILEQGYRVTFNMLLADLLVQVGAAQLFDGVVTYNGSNGTFDGDLALSHDEISGLVAIAPSAGPDNNAFWLQIGRFLEGTKGLANLTSTELSWLEAAITGTDTSLHWTQISNAVSAEMQVAPTDDALTGSTGADVIHGNDGNDDIRGYAGADTLYGDAGDDYVNGGDGVDSLYGGDGNDFLVGEYGNDTYYGGTGGNRMTDADGNDIYVHGGGNDLISDYNGTDQIFLPTGILLGDLIFSRVSSENSSVYFNDLLIQVNGAGTIQIKDQFYSSSLAVETLVFSDTSTFSLSSVDGADVRLTNGNDTFSTTSNANFSIYGFDGNDTITAQGTGAHTIDGGNGNDSLQGGSGSNDTYIASTGFDVIQENGGIDTILIPSAYDPSDVSFYRIGNYDLGILIEGLGQIKITGQLTWLTSNVVESLHFLSDSSTLNLTTISVTTLGTSGNDTLSAPDYNTNTNDVLDGREGDDTLNGGVGNDTYIFSEGHDKIAETSGDDTLRVRDIYSPANIVDMHFVYAPQTADMGGLYIGDSSGNYVIVQKQTQATNFGLEHIVFGNGTIWNLSDIEVNSYGTSGNDGWDGYDIGDASSNDTMYGYGGNDSLNAGNGNDAIYGGDGDDYLLGGVGNDLIEGGLGDDNIQGGSDEDTASYASATAGVTVDLTLVATAQNTIGAGTDSLTAVEGLIGSAYNDTLTGDGNANVIEGGAGNDALVGGFGTDTASYASAASGVTVNLATTTAQNTVGAGTDTISGFENLKGSVYGDTLTGDAIANLINSGAGNDTVQGAGGDDTLLGGAGTDTLSYAAEASAVTVSLLLSDTQNTLGSGNDTIVGFENLTGSAQNDTLTGNVGANVIDGGNGNDVIEGGAGNDTLTGGMGTDTATYANAASGVTVNLATATAQNTVGAGTDTMSGFENLTGSAFGDTLTGDSAANVIDGGNGNDTIQGGAGNDTLTGGQGTDTLTYISSSAAVTVNLATATAQNTVGAGTDTISGFENLTGSAFNDTLTGDGNANVIEGGAGNDTINAAGGNDTLTYANAASAVTVNLATATAQNTGGAGTDTISAFENLTGSAFNDTLTGDGNANIMEGGAGNDTINGAGGTDTLTYVSATSGVTLNLGTATAQNTGGAGTDTISNFENLTGSAFNDTLTGNGNANVIEGGAGNDTIDGAGGTDTVAYISAAYGVTVSLATATAQNTIGAGTDTLSNFENLTGSEFDDVLTGNSSANTVDGGNGNDIIEGGAGTDTLKGSGGTDTLTYINAASAVTVNLATVTGQNTVGAGTDTISGFENLRGSAFNDTLTGDGNANVIEGGAGNDTVNGAGGNDTLTYANAASAVTVNLATATAQNTGGAGTDTISAFENLTGSAFNDTLTGDGNANIMEGGAGNDNINGAGGTDTVTYISAGSAVTVNLATATAQNTLGAGTDTLSGFENLTGSAFHDTLTGDGNANVIDGGAGNDLIDGGAGNDTLTGGQGFDTVSYASAAAAVTVNLTTLTGQNTVGAGTDTISGFENLTGSAFGDTLTGDANANIIDGGAGNDTITGGAGIDTVSYVSAGSAVTVSLATASAQNTVGAGTDTVTGFENLTGSAYNDNLTGDASANTLDGGAGNDTLTGGAGNDMLYGGAGTDLLYGGLGLDKFGFDTATAFSAVDTVKDFNATEGDAIDIHSLLTGYDPLTSAITDFIQMTDSHGSTAVSVDRDGAGSTYAFAQIATIEGVTGLTDEAALLAAGNLLAA